MKAHILSLINSNNITLAITLIESQYSISDKAKRLWNWNKTLQPLMKKEQVTILTLANPKIHCSEFIISKGWESIYDIRYNGLKFSWATGGKVFSDLKELPILLGQSVKVDGIDYIVKELYTEEVYNKQYNTGNIDYIENGMKFYYNEEKQWGGVYIREQRKHKISRSRIKRNTVGGSRTSYWKMLFNASCNKATYLKILSFYLSS
jgi:hypothetical protein